MALLDFLKKRKGGPIAPKTGEKEAEKKARLEEKTAQETKKRGAAYNLKESRTAWHILRAPHVTEKATNLTANNQYTFKMLGNPAKPQIKRAVEEIYNVHVGRIAKITVPGKERRRGRRIGWKPGYTKAIITLRQGEKIEILPH